MLLAHDPTRPRLELWEGATLAASTDCLDVEADRDKKPRATSPVMCGHAPGNRGGATLNTGTDQTATKSHNEPASLQL